MGGGRVLHQQTPKIHPTIVISAHAAGRVGGCGLRAAYQYPKINATIENLDSQLLLDQPLRQGSPQAHHNNYWSLFKHKISLNVFPSMGFCMLKYDNFLNKISFGLFGTVLVTKGNFVLSELFLVTSDRPIKL